MKVRDVMTTEVTTVDPSASLRDVAAILDDRGIAGAPVVAGEEVVGVVSESDIVMKEQGPELGERGLLKRLRRHDDGETAAKLEARTAQEAMTSPAVTIEPGRDLTRAAKLMVERGVNRLPVVEHGKLLGIVTRADLMHAFVRSDEEIAQEVREGVIQRTFWLAPEEFAVKVEDGRVTLSGEVEAKEVAELLAAFVERVPGVVEVESRLSWRAEARR